MELRAIIARHGETLWNAEGRIQGSAHDNPLSRKGIKQAYRLGIFLRSLNKKLKILSSPMIRAFETANIASQLLGGSDILIVEELIEMNFGDLQGMFKRDARKHSFYEERQENKLHIPYPNGESYYDVFLRLKDSLQEIIASTEEMLFIVGHESVNRMIPPVFDQKQFPLDKAVLNRQKNDEVVLVFDDRVNKVRLD